MTRLRPAAVGLLAALLALTVGCALAWAVVTQKGRVRVRVGASLSPKALPRQGTVPVKVKVSGQISTTDGSAPPQLRRLRIDINRHGRFDSAGLPVCRVDQIHPATSARALAVCGGSLVGEGRFAAYIVLAGQEPYATSGRLLVFNGRSHGDPVLLGQIYSAHPFASSFVIPFTFRRRARGQFGTVLEAALPKALGDWGYLTGISMTLARSYTHAGTLRSFLSAGCPAPKGFPGAVFPLARTSFDFAGGARLSATVTGSCKVR